MLGSRNRRAYRKMNVKHPPSCQTVAFHSVPAANCGWRNAQIVRNAFESIVLSHAINSETPCISLRIAAIVSAWRDWDYKFRTRLDRVGHVELIGVRNRLHRGAIGARERHQSLAFRNRVIPPPQA